MALFSVCFLSAPQSQPSQSPAAPPSASFVIACFSFGLHSAPHDASMFFGAHPVRFSPTPSILPSRMSFKKSISSAFTTPLFLTMWKSMASMSLPMGCARAAGTILRRTSWFGACSESARLTLGRSSVMRRMAPVTPTVETVTCRGDRLKRRLSIMNSTAYFTFL